MTRQEKLEEELRKVLKALLDISPQLLLLLDAEEDIKQKYGKHKAYADGTKIRETWNALLKEADPILYNVLKQKDYDSD